MTGERGESGDRGVAGERGPKGDHGQDGERGKTGAAGLSAPYLGRSKTLSLFLFVVLAFALLSWRTEVANRGVMRNQFQSCQISREILVKYNALQDANIRIETKNQFIDESVRQPRLTALQAAKIALPECGIR